MLPDKIFQEVQDLIRSFKELVFYLPLEDKYHNAIASIEKSLSEPCRLAITGRVKAGKSSLINVLLGFDYAVVGTSETTATINVFKYGEPKFEDKPILCEYIDGKSKWISKKDLDSLQGFSEEIVAEISSIKHLTYFIKDDRLTDTVLIDTPGIDAVVGNDGDAHQMQTEAFLGLRKRHEDETISISNNADAVLLLLGDVAHDSDIDFINGFLSNRGNISSLNTIAVMSQIDLTDERIERRHEMAKDRYNKLSSYVNCVLPISSGLKRFAPSKEQAYLIKNTLSKVPSKEMLDNLLLRSAKMYFLPKVPGVDISLELRKSIYPDAIPFRCFAVIAKILYDNDIDTALRLIDEISGIQALKQTLDIHFFGRSKQIKSEIAIKQVLSLIWDILNCNTLSSKTVLSDNEIESLSTRFYNLQIKLEELSQITEDTNKYFQGFISLIENKNLFSDSEFCELTNLFSEKISYFDESRLSFWYCEMNNSSNEIRKEISSLAYLKYTDLAFL